MPVAWNKRIWLKILVHYMDAYVLYASILKKKHIISLIHIQGQHILTIILV